MKQIYTRPLKPHLDIVIPAFNEEQVLDELLNRIKTTFSSENQNKYNLGKVSIIFINDGSKDKTLEILKSNIDTFPLEYSIINFSRNFGHQPAVSAGIDYCKGDIVAITDADLQDPPEVILEMVAKWREGYDIVFGERKNRKESKLLKICYWSFYRLLSYFSEVEINMDSGDFCIMDRKVIDEMKKLPEKIRFPRGLRAWVGFSHAALPYERMGRFAGESKYSFKALLKLATHGIASMSIKPLKMTQFLCFCFFILFSILSFYSLFRYFSSSVVDTYIMYFLAGYILTTFSSALILFSIYIQSSYIGRIYLEVKSRPTYVISNLITRGE